MKIRKITEGYVIQEYDLEKRRWTSQKFVAGYEAEWEDEDGEYIDTPTTSYLPFSMKQPSGE